jgi:TM2 domain-containing membrane protein YozV
MNEPQEYLLRWRGRVAGPFPVPEINRQLDEHEIGMGHEIFFEDNWITVDEFLAALHKPAVPAPAPEPPPPPFAPPSLRMKPSPMRIKVSLTKEPEFPKASELSAVRGTRPRRRLIFASLAVAAGFLGAHNFYARQWLTGLLQLFLSVATYLMGFGIIASWLWAMAEAVFVRKDGDGIDMI